MRPPTLVVHVDVDAFFASVAVREDPSLAGLPVAVAVPDGIVACAGYGARAFGVRAGMLTRDALLLCPQLVTVPIVGDVYERAGAELFEVLHRVAATVEPGSVEEAFLDVPGLAWDDVGSTAPALRQRICRESRLPVTMGVGRTKMMAKLASRWAKPDGLRVVTPSEEAVLRPALRLDELWGVGDRTAGRLHERGLATVGDLAGLDVDALCRLTGTAMGRRLRAIADGRDDAVVREPGPRSSVGAEVTLRDATAADLDDALVRLSHRVAERLRAGGLRCGRVTVTALRSASGPSATLDVATDDAAVLLATARSLLPAGAVGADGVRLVVARLSPSAPTEQPALPGLG